MAWEKAHEIRTMMLLEAPYGVIAVMGKSLIPGGGGEHIRGRGLPEVVFRI